jgi:GT2 family glycosyltransferase
MIAVIVLTHNRAHLLRRCVEDVLLRTSPSTTEILIWNNASEDETEAYLQTVEDPRVKVVNHPENIGINAYALATTMTTAPYIVEVDDDVVDAPDTWDHTMLDAFRKIPNIGYLVADLKDDPNDSAFRYLQYVKERRNVFTRREIEGIHILEGPTGGGCAMTSREVYERVGGFRQHKKLVFWHEDATYVRDVRRHGFRTAYLEDLKVWHMGSPYYSEPSAAKLAFHEHRDRSELAKNLVKRSLLAAPFFPRLNARFRFFDPPDDYEPPDWETGPKE